MRVVGRALVIVGLTVVRRTVSNLTEAKISFGLIPPEHWYQPAWIDEDRAAQGRQKMHEQNIIYAGT